MKLAISRILVVVVLSMCSLPVKTTDSSFMSAESRDGILLERPIVGILAHSTPEELAKFGKSFVPASYVKFIESAGARVAPVSNNLTPDQIKKLFTSINGVLFPGGGSLFNTGYARVGEILFNLSVEKYVTIPGLNKFFRVLSTNLDRQGKQFVSTIEGNHYPLYGVQWHPEKNPFEWTREENIPHSAEAILASQYMANIFINQARQSRHHFPSKEEEMEALIYNHEPVNTGHVSKYEQCYFF